MFVRITIALAVFSFFVTACEKNSGRPAPNSVPQPGAPAQAPQAQPNATATPTPAPGMGKQNPDPAPVDPVKTPVKSSKAVFFNNNGAAEDGVLVKQTFLLANFDPTGMPEGRRVLTVQQEGKPLTVNGRDLTHLSDESYLSCSSPACINRIADVSEYRHHASKCWFPSLSSVLVARLEFDFDDQGTLKFYATIDDNGGGQIHYGATNIGYKFDGRALLVDGFVAATSIDGGENRAIRLSGYTTDGRGSLPFVKGTTYGKPGFNAKSTVSVEFGTMKDGKFTTSGNARANVGGTIACLTKTERTNFDNAGE
ncbi:MAG: hypothetical protein ABL958_14115 [Bdellovibrionia bacterium]